MKVGKPYWTASHSPTAKRARLEIFCRVPINSPYCVTRTSNPAKAASLLEALKRWMSPFSLKIMTPSMSKMPEIWLSPDLYPYRLWIYWDHRFLHTASLSAADCSPAPYHALITSHLSSTFFVLTSWPFIAGLAPPLFSPTHWWDFTIIVNC